VEAGIQRRSLINTIAAHVRGDGGRSKRKKNQRVLLKMEAETAVFPDLSDFEFFMIILQNTWEKLVGTYILVGYDLLAVFYTLISEVLSVKL
jgi:hypothetical protein